MSLRNLAWDKKAIGAKSLAPPALYPIVTAPTALSQWSTSTNVVAVTVAYFLDALANLAGVTYLILTF